MSEQEYEQMVAQDYEYSIASQIAYNYYDNNNDVEETQEILDTYIEGYTFDPDYSYDNASTIIRPDGSAILAFRGTRPTNLDDLNADASILAGQHHTSQPHYRFVEAENHYNFVKERFRQVDLTGHSLGGTIADYIGRSNNERAVVFSAGETPFSLSVIPEATASKTRIYKTNTFDVVSFSNSLYPHAESIRVVPQIDSNDSYIGSHNLSNFLPPYEMLPISSEPDVIIPSMIPIQTKLEVESNTPEKVKEIEFDKNERFISNLCLEMPYLFQCKKKIQLKIKNKKKL